ncbi:TRAF-like family protein [Euphorbia peplus]|nr:TRAF-like family protein [Euphorbia peplus]
MGDATEADKSLPRNYEVTIENFSMIKNTVEIYKSAVFEAGGYKWKLVVHPNGNRSKKVKDHLSFYLALAERVELGWEVDAVFLLYFRKNSDKFPGLDFGTPQRRFHFHPLKLEHGFDKFIELEKLTVELEKLTVEDSCIFGAKILSATKAKTEGRAERLSMFDIAPVITHTWKIINFSTKLNQECISSEIFGDGDIKWKIQFYPRRNEYKEINPSIQLVWANPTSCRIYAKVIFSIKFQSSPRRKHATLEGNFWFSGSSPEQGWLTVSLDELKKCFPVIDILFGESDVFIIQAKVAVLGTADAIVP